MSVDSKATSQQQTKEATMSDIKIQHFHCAQTGRLVLTIATQLQPDGLVRLAGAVVSPKDTPSRELGAKIATGRICCERNGKNVYVLQLAVVREMIVNRTIGALFPTKHRLPELRKHKYTASEE